MLGGVLAPEPLELAIALREVDVLRLALTCTRLLEAARAAADAKLLRRWPLWRRRIATGESPLVQLVVLELSCVLAVGGTWKAEEYSGAGTSGTSATDSVEVAFVRSRALAAASHADGLAPSVRRASHASELCVDWVGGLAPLPHTWRRGCALALHNLVVVVGGSIHNEQTAQCAAYAPERDEWLVGPALAHRRNVASAVQHLGAAWVVGGFDGRDHLASTEILRPPAADEAAGAGGRGGQGEGALAAAGVLRGWCWQSGPPLLCARSSASVASVGSCLVAMGGYGPQSPANTPTPRPTHRAVAARAVEHRNDFMCSCVAYGRESVGLRWRQMMNRAPGGQRDMHSDTR